MSASAEENYPAENIFYDETQTEENIWLAGSGLKGSDAYVMMDLLQWKNVTGFKIRNMKKIASGEGGTNKFSIFNGKEKIVKGDLAAVDENGKAENIEFTLDKPVVLRYLKFQIDSFHGTGGGLKYFSIQGGKII